MSEVLNSIFVIGYIFSAQWNLTRWKPSTVVTPGQLAIRVAILGFLVAMVYYQYIYAMKNYPDSRGWHFLLWFVGFGVGTLGLWGVAFPEFTSWPSTWYKLSTCAANGGVPMAIASRYLPPRKNQSVIPKKRELPPPSEQ